MYRYRPIHAYPLVQNDFKEEKTPQTLSKQEADVFFLTVYYLWIRFHLRAAWEEAMHPFDEEKLIKLPKDRVEFALEHLDGLPNREDLVRVLDIAEVRALFSYVEETLRNQVQCDSIRQRSSYFDLPSLRKFCIYTAVDMLTFAQFGGWVRLPAHLRIRWFEQMTIWEMEEKCKIIEYLLARRSVDLAALQQLLPEFK